MEKKLIVGIDEVGRGPLVGPVVTAAVILNSEMTIPGLTDSKKLSEKRRKSLSDIIKKDALAWSIGEASHEEIDEINIHHATLLAMKRAYEGLGMQADLAQVDGKFCPQIDCKSEAIIKGDLTIPAISAASIIAKVYRDEQMIELHAQYPQYGFNKHKGYPTKLHLEMLAKHGVTPYHRRSYAPVRNLELEIT